MSGIFHNNEFTHKNKKRLIFKNDFLLFNTYNWYIYTLGISKIINLHAELNTTFFVIYFSYNIVHF